MKVIFLYGVAAICIAAVLFIVIVLCCKWRKILDLIKREWRRTPVDVVFVWVFFIALLVPLPVLAFGQRQKASPLMENRFLAGFPDLATLPATKWADSLSGFLADHSIYRKHLIPRYFLLHEWYLRSPVNYAFHGGDDQLFTLLQLRERVQNPEDEDATLFKFRAYLVGLNKLLADRGIYFIVAFPPDKTKVLEAYLPEWAKDNVRHFRLERMCAMLTANGIRHIELHREFKNLEVKTLYNRLHDPYHWNSVATHHFYQILARRLEADLGPAYAPVPMEGHYAYIREHRNAPIKLPDTAVFMKLTRTEKLSLSFYPGIGQWGDDPLIRIVDVESSRRAPTVTHNADVASGKVVLIGDSFILDESVPHLSRNMPGHPDWDAPVSPLIYNTRELLQLFFTDTTLETMQKVCADFSPQVVVLERGERGFWYSVDNDLALYGEKLLGTPRLDLFEATASMPEETTPGIDVSVAGGDGREATIHVRNAGAFLPLPTITTNNDGYAVVGGNIVSPTGGSAELAYTDADGKRAVLYSPTIQDRETRVYFQVRAKPNTECRLEFRPGHLPGDYRLLPVSIP